MKPGFYLGRTRSYALVEIAETIRSVLSETNGAQIDVGIMNGEKFVNSDSNCSLFYYSFDFMPQISILDSVKSISSSLIHIRK